MESQISPIGAGAGAGRAAGRAAGRDPGATARGVPLPEVVRGLGSDTVTPLGPAGVERSVTGSEIADPVEPFPEQAGLVLLAPAAGGSPGPDLTALARRAAAHGAGAVALKCRDRDVPAVTATAVAHGIPVLRVSEHVSWKLFDALLSQLLGDLQHPDGPHRDHDAEPLFALANELAEFFGGSVAIEDLSRRIVAYSAVPGQLIDSLRTQGILTRRVPDAPANDDQYRTVLRSERPVIYPAADGEAARIATGVHAGTLPLGSIWIISPSPHPELTPEQDARIRAAASVAAAHLLDGVRARSASQLPREERLRTLLDGTALTGSELAELGLPEERGAALLTFELADADGPVPLGQLRSTVYRHLALHHPEVVAVIRDRSVHALIRHDPVRDAAAVVAPLLPLLDRLLGPGTRVALPGIAHRSGDIAPLRELGDRLLATGPAPGAGTGLGTGTDLSPDPAGAGSERILTVPALRARLALDAVGRLLAAEPVLRQPALDRLCAEEPSTADTLAAWCAHFGNVARTARELGVHENTVRHRVRQAETQYGVPLATADERLTAWLQLRTGPPRHGGTPLDLGAGRNTPAPGTLSSRGA